MWNHYEYLLIIFLPLSVFVAILLAALLAKKQVEVIHSLSSYEKKQKLDANIIAKAEYINSQLAPLGLVYNLKFDLIYTTDNGNTIDKLKLIQDNNPELFDEIKDLEAVKGLLSLP